MSIINDFAKQQIDAIKEKCEVIKPLVVIQCIAYNHEHYIKDALDGFVMQKTDFPFVAIVHDDASSDKTAEIIKEYAEKFPDIIQPIFELENQYSKKGAGVVPIMNYACEVIAAKYIAMCEGDDYWTDPLKLQKQVDFLESHPEYSLCFHNVEVVSEQPGIIEPLYTHLKEGFFDADTIISKWSVPTCSALLIREVFSDCPKDPRFIYGDIILWMNACKHGKAYCLREKMGVYRRCLSGWMLSHYNSNKRNIYKLYKRNIIHLNAIKEYFPNIGNNGLNQRLKDYYTRVFILSLLYDRKEMMNWAKEGLEMFGLSYVSELIKRSVIYIYNRLKIRYK